METIPSVTLLDIHCPQSAEHEANVADITEEMSTAFANLVDFATRARALRAEIENQQDGLETTRAAYLELVGDEGTAQSLNDLRRVETWHEVANRRIEEWKEQFKSPPGPEMPSPPRFETDVPVGDYVPIEVLPRLLEQYQTSVRRSANKLASTLRAVSSTHYSNLEAMRRQIQTSLGEEQEVTAELAEVAERHRTRLTALEQKAADLADLDGKISKGFESTDELIQKASRCWAELRRARKEACREVNASMSSFFVRLNHNSVTRKIDDLLDDLKTGTFLHESSVQEMRDEIDRSFFVRSAIEHLQYIDSDVAPEGLSVSSANAKKIAHEAMDREKYDGIAQLAVVWPDDGIEILRKPTDGEPVHFDDLTEGLKALAIKEISFAASQRPAVSDQPEDAVPTTAIFENLVPTLREQRASRQFIIASHDANVVVSGDMECVVVFPPAASESPITGTLFDPIIRDHAIGLLEGGDRAFELRRRRYGDHE